MSVLILVLTILALLLASIEQVRARGTSLIAWAVIALAAIHLIGQLG
jgi:hypothetical protein